VVRTERVEDAEEDYRLCSYRPLSSTAAGQRSAVAFGIPPFVDGSCRREPDLGIRYPSITSLCRYDRFAPHLQVGHRIAYITVKRTYQDPAPHWRLVACLRVIARFENHRDAANWYRNRRLALPSNCMVRDNPPLSLDKTMTPRRNLRSWNGVYAARAASLGTFLICEVEALNTTSPPKLTAKHLTTIFGRVPGTQSPPRITREQYERLRRKLVPR